MLPIKVVLLGDSNESKSWHMLSTLIRDTPDSIEVSIYRLIFFIEDKCSFILGINGQVIF